MQRIKSPKFGSVVLAVALTMAASALFQISSYRNARRVEEISARDARVRDVLDALAALRSAVQEAVIGHSAYLLDGKSRDLDSYRRAAGSVPALLAQVCAMTADDPAQAAPATRLRPLIESELEDLRHRVGEPRRRAPDATPADGVDAGSDPGRVGQIGRILDRMTEAEQQLRTEYLVRTHAAASAQARALVAAGVYRVFVLLSGCTVILLQHARQRRTEQLCRRSEELFRNAFDHTATGMALADGSGRWVKVNRALCQMVGYQREELLQSGSRAITHADDVETESDRLEQLTTGELDSCQLEKRFIHQDGHTVWALVTHSVVRNENQRPQTFVSHVQDITERKQAEDRLRHQSLHDALTGLPNRLLLVERIQRGIDRAKRDPSHRLAVLFLDLDRFKLINDSLGHAAGDRLLVTVAQRLGKCVRLADAVGAGEAGCGEGAGGGCPARHTVARLAGDEFTILLEGLRASGDAEVVAGRILREVSRPVDLGGREISTGASIGIVHGEARRYESARELLADADAALYRAKAAGRGRYAIFDADMRQSSLRRVRLSDELRHAAEHWQFVLRYQPIVSLRDRRVAGFEARVRWEHPELGSLEAEQFLDAAEEAGVSVALGRWVLREACRQLADWRGPSHHELFVAVPLSREQLFDPELVRLVRDLMGQTRHPSDDGGLRVTVGESLLMQHPDLVNGTLAELRSTGVRAWVGNFGAGITSLSCLRSAPLDGLKIDGRMIGSAAGRRDCAAVVHSVLELARNLRLQVVAEGLEAPEQVAMLQAMDCPLGQGVYFAAPLVAAEAQALLSARSLPLLALHSA